MLNPKLIFLPLILVIISAIGVVAFSSRESTNNPFIYTIETN